jgi:UPF0271 protein
MGARLDGPELKRNEDVDLVSEAVAPGTLQVPPGGKPILLLGDCQTIGGYPKIAHVITVDLPIAAQLRPGDQVRFREVALADAHQLLAERERNLENFGRKELRVTPEEIFDAVRYQLGVFQAIAEAAGVRPNHVKPHGALYNMAVRDQEMASAITRAIAQVDPTLILFAPVNSALGRAGEAVKLQIAREVFADRNYLSDGSLVPRSRPDALLHDPVEASERVLRMLREGKVRSVDGADVDVLAETICVHGDTPGAVEFARALRSRLEKESVTICATKSKKG